MLNNSINGLLCLAPVFNGNVCGFSPTIKHDAGCGLKYSSIPSVPVTKDFLKKSEMNSNFYLDEENRLDHLFSLVY